MLMAACNHSFRLKSLNTPKFVLQIVHPPNLDYQDPFTNPTKNTPTQTNPQNGVHRWVRWHPGVGAAGAAKRQAAAAAAPQPFAPLPAQLDGGRARLGALEAAKWTGDRGKDRDWRSKENLYKCL